ncbi:putative lipoprotein [Acidovorax sp. RAC01]|nr:putative lipoprotein [Acidovorax sp. RAC01]
MSVSSPLSLRSRVAGLTARALLAFVALPLAACSGDGDAPRDEGSGGVRPVFFISALEPAGAPRALAAPGSEQFSFALLF